MRNSIGILSLRGIIAAIAACSLWACSHSHQEVSIPKRPGYPRAYAYDTCYVQAQGVPIAIEVNSQAQHHAIKRGGAYWLNIDYPRYNASIYCTFTPVTPATVASVLDNRSERLQLNLGGAVADMEQYETPAGYSVAIATAPSAKATPLQFLASNGRWVLSGAAFFNNSDQFVDIDSVAPMVATLRRDIEHALITLHDRP